MDELNLYDDLDEFQEQQEKKSKELQEAEEKYQQSLKTIVELQEENKKLKKNIQRIELGFQSLLDTARSEINRKDREIDRLRKEKDDICFRRKLPNNTANTNEKSHLARNSTVNNPLSHNAIKDNETSLKESVALPSTYRNKDEKTESNKRNRCHDDERNHPKEYKRHCSARNYHDEKYPHKSYEHAKTYKKFEEDHGVSGARNRDNHKESTSKKDYNRNRSRECRENRKDSSRDTYEKSLKASKNVEHYSKSTHRSRSRERNKDDNKYKYFERKRSREHKNTRTFSKSSSISPQRRNKFHSDTNRDHYKKSQKTFRTTENMNSQKTFDKDLGEEKNKNLTVKMTQNENIEETAKKQNSALVHVDIPNKRDGNEEAQASLSIILKDGQANKSDKMFDKESENNVQLEIKSVNLSTTETTKLYTPRRGALFNEISGKSPNECRSTPINTVEAQKSSSVVLKQGQENKSDKIFDKKNENNVQLEIKAVNSSTTETSKLCTPRKVALFNEIFGKSPSECRSTPTNSTNSNSLLNNIKDILAKASQIEVVSSATTSPADYTDINSNMSTPINKTIEVESSASNTPSSIMNPDNELTTDRDEIDNCFIPNQKLEQYVETIACVDLTKIAEDDIAIETDFIQIPGLDLCYQRKEFNAIDNKNTSIQIDEKTETTTNKVATEKGCLALNEETIVQATNANNIKFIEIIDIENYGALNEKRGMHKSSVASAYNSVTIDQTTEYNKELSENMNAINETESAKLIKDLNIKENFELKSKESNCRHFKRDKSLVNSLHVQNTTTSKISPNENIFELATKAGDIPEDFINKVVIIEAINSGIVPLKNPYKIQQDENRLKNENKIKKSDESFIEVEDRSKANKEVEVKSQTKSINLIRSVEETILIDKSESNEVDKSPSIPAALDTQSAAPNQKETSYDSTTYKNLVVNLNAEIRLEEKAIMQYEKQFNSPEELQKPKDVETLEEETSSDLTDEPQQMNKAFVNENSAIEIMYKELSEKLIFEKEKICKRKLHIKEDSIAKKSNNEDVLMDIIETVELLSPAKVVQVEEEHISSTYQGLLSKESESTPQEEDEEESLGEETLDKVVQIIELPNQTKDVQIEKENLLSILEQKTLSEKSEERKSFNDEKLNERFSHAVVVQVEDENISTITEQGTSYNLLESDSLKEKPLNTEKLIEILQIVELPTKMEAVQIEKEYVFSPTEQDTSSDSSEKSSKENQSTKVISEEDKSLSKEKLIEVTEIVKLPEQAKVLQSEKEDLLSILEQGTLSSDKSEDRKSINEGNLDKFVETIELFSPAKEMQVEKKSLPSITEQETLSKLPQCSPQEEKLIEILEIVELPTQKAVVQTEMQYLLPNTEQGTSSNSSEKSRKDDDPNNKENLDEIMETDDLLCPAKVAQIEEERVPCIAEQENSLSKEELIEILQIGELPTQKAVVQTEKQDFLPATGQQTSTDSSEKSKKGDHPIKVIWTEESKPHNKENLDAIMETLDLLSPAKAVPLEEESLYCIGEQETTSQLIENSPQEESSSSKEELIKILQIVELHTQKTIVQTEQGTSSSSSEKSRKYDHPIKVIYSEESKPNNKDEIIETVDLISPSKAMTIEEESLTSIAEQETSSKLSENASQEEKSLRKEQFIEIVQIIELPIKTDVVQIAKENLFSIKQRTLSNSSEKSSKEDHSMKVVCSKKRKSNNEENLNKVVESVEMISRLEVVQVEEESLSSVAEQGISSKLPESAQEKNSLSTDKLDRLKQMSELSDQPKVAVVEDLYSNTQQEFSFNLSEKSTKKENILPASNKETTSNLITLLDDDDQTIEVINKDAITIKSSNIYLPDEIITNIEQTQLVVTEELFTASAHQIAPNERRNLASFVGGNATSSLSDIEHTTNKDFENKDTKLSEESVESSRDEPNKGEGDAIFKHVNSEEGIECNNDETITSKFISTELLKNRTLTETHIVETSSSQASSSSLTPKANKDETLDKTETKVTMTEDVQNKTYHLDPCYSPKLESITADSNEENKTETNEKSLVQNSKNMTLDDLAVLKANRDLTTTNTADLNSKEQINSNSDLEAKSLTKEANKLNTNKVRETESHIEKSLHEGLPPQFSTNNTKTRVNLCNADNQEVVLSSSKDEITAKSCLTCPINKIAKDCINKDEAQVNDQEVLTLKVTDVIQARISSTLTPENPAKSIEFKDSLTRELKSVEVKNKKGNEEIANDTTKDILNESGLSFSQTENPEVSVEAAEIDDTHISSSVTLENPQESVELGGNLISELKSLDVETADKKRRKAVINDTTKEQAHEAILAIMQNKMSESALKLTKTSNAHNSTPFSKENPAESIVLRGNRTKEFKSIDVEISNKRGNEESTGDQDRAKIGFRAEIPNNFSKRVITKEINIEGEIVEVVKDIIDLNEVQTVSENTEILRPSTAILHREECSLERVQQLADKSIGRSYENSAESLDNKTLQSKLRISEAEFRDIDKIVKRIPSTEDETLINKKEYLINEIQYSATQHQQAQIQIKATPEKDVLPTSPLTIPETYNTIPVLPSIRTTSPTPSNFSGIFSKKSSNIVTNEDELIKSKKKSPHFSTKPKEYILPAASVLCNVDNLKNATKSNKKLHWELLDNKNEMTEIEDDADIDTTDDDRLKIKEEPLETVSTSPKQNSLDKNLTHCNVQKSSPSETDTQTEDESLLSDLRRQRGNSKKLTMMSKVQKIKQCKRKLLKNVKAGVNAIEMRNAESLRDGNLKPFLIAKRPVGRPRKQGEHAGMKNEEITLHRKKRGRKSKNIDENLKLQQEVPRSIISNSKLDNYKETQTELKEVIQKSKLTESDELEPFHRQINYDGAEKHQHKIISTKSYKSANCVENNTESMDAGGKNIPETINSLANSMKILSSSVERLEICDESCSSKDSNRQRKTSDTQHSSTSDIDTSIKKDCAAESNKQLKGKGKCEVNQFIDRIIVSPKSLSNKETQAINLVNDCNCDNDGVSGEKPDALLVKDKIKDNKNVLPITDTLISSRNIVAQKNCTISRGNSETDEVLPDKQQNLQKDKSLILKSLTKPLFNKKYKSTCSNNKLKKFISLEDIGINVRPPKVHLSSYRIPKIRKDPEDAIDNSWKLETYVELENEGNREQSQQCNEQEKKDGCALPEKNHLEKNQKFSDYQKVSNIPKEHKEKCHINLNKMENAFNKVEQHKTKMLSENESKSSASNFAINFGNKTKTGKRKLVSPEKYDERDTRVNVQTTTEIKNLETSIDQCLYTRKTQEPKPITQKSLHFSNLETNPDSCEPAVSNSSTKLFKKSINLHRRILDSSSDEDTHNEVEKNKEKLSSSELNKNVKTCKLEAEFETSLKEPTKSSASGGDNSKIRRKSMYAERSATEGADTADNKTDRINKTIADPKISVQQESAIKLIVNKNGENKQPLNVIKSFKMRRKLTHAESTSLNIITPESKHVANKSCTPLNLEECNTIAKKHNTELLSIKDGNKNIGNSFISIHKPKESSEQTKPIASLKMRRKSMYVERSTIYNKDDNTIQSTKAKPSLEKKVDDTMTEHQKKSGTYISVATEQNPNKMRRKSANIDRGSWNTQVPKNVSVESEEKKKHKDSDNIDSQQTNTGSKSRKSTNQTQNNDLLNKDGNSLNSQEDHKNSKELKISKQEAEEKTNELILKIDNNQKRIDYSTVKTEDQVKETKLIMDAGKLNEFRKVIQKKSNDSLNTNSSNTEKLHLVQASEKKVIKMHTNQSHTSDYRSANPGGTIGKLNELTKELQARSGCFTPERPSFVEELEKRSRKSTNQSHALNSRSLDPGGTIDAGALKKLTNELHQQPKVSQNTDSFNLEKPNLAAESEKQLIKMRRKSTNQSHNLDFRSAEPGDTIDTHEVTIFKQDLNNPKENSKHGSEQRAVALTQTIHDSNKQALNVEVRKKLEQNPIDPTPNIIGSYNLREKSDSTSELSNQKSIKMRRKSTSQYQTSLNQPDTNELKQSQLNLQVTSEVSKLKSNSIPILKADSDSSVTVAQQKTIRPRRKSTNQRRILDSSTDDDEPLIKKTTVIPSDVNIPLIPIAKPNQRRRRLVKVLSTSYDSPANLTNSSQNSSSSLTSPNHPIFNTEVSPQSTEFAASLPVTHNQHDDKQFKEIDSKLHEIFRSPIYTADYKISPVVAVANQTLLPPQINEFLPNVTIDETVHFNRENDQSSLNVSQVNESRPSLTDTTVEHNNSEIKHLSLGSADYRFEKVSDNVINLFISRKRKRKHNN